MMKHGNPFLKLSVIFFLILAAFTGKSFAQDSLPSPDSNVVIVPPPAELAVSEEETAELDFMETGHHLFSRKSPYLAVLSHLYFLQEDTWHPDSAAMVLNGLDPNTVEGQEKAIKLKQFLDGAGYFIDLDALPRNATYTDSASGLHKFVLIPNEPEIFLYRKELGWVYSLTTVNAIDKLHSRVFPFGTMEWLPKWSKQKFFGLQVWQYIGILAFVLLTFLLHKLLTKVLGGTLEFALERFITKDHAVEFFSKIARPISLLILFYVLSSVYPALQFPVSINQWVVAGFNVMIPVFWMLIALQCVNLLMAYFAKRAAETESTLDDQLVPLVRNLLKGLVVIASVMVILNRLNVDITALIGGVAFGSFALALAAQDAVKNLFGSILIFIDRPFQIGDWIIVDGHEGVVEQVSVRSTRIRTFANSLISIPNGNIASGAINNMGARVYRRFVTRVGVTYDTPPHLIEVFVEGIRELVRIHPSTRKDVFEVHFDTMGDSSLQILVYTFFAVPTWSQELEGRQELLLSIMRLASQLGISFAFPTQTLHIDSFPEKKGLAPGHPGNQEEYAARMRAFISEYKAKQVQLKGTPEQEIGGADTLDGSSGGK